MPALLDRLVSRGINDRSSCRHVTSAPDVRFYLPAASLRPLVTSYYVIDAPEPLVDFTHPEWANIRFLLSGDLRFGDPEGREMTPPPDASILGRPTARGGSTAVAALTIGIGLTPIGWLSLIGSDASKTANAYHSAWRRTR